MYVLSNGTYYASHPAEIFQVWKGGLIQYGGILGGLAGGFWFCRKHSLSFVRLADSVVIGLSLGFAISRIGCLMAGCCFGNSTALPWALIFHHPLSIAPVNVPLHPTQIYSFAADFLIFLYLFRKRAAYDGQIALHYFVLASASRLFIDLFRASNFSTTALILFILSIIILIVKTARVNLIGGTMKLREVLKSTLVIAAAMSLAACGIISTQTATRGHDISGSEVDQLQKGQSTEKDVLKLFGPPTKVRDTEEGKEFLYEYAKSGGLKWNLLFSVGGGTEQKSLLVWLDKNGVVTDYAFKQS